MPDGFAEVSSAAARAVQGAPEDESMGASIPDEPEVRVPAEPRTSTFRARQEPRPGDAAVQGVVQNEIQGTKVG